MDNNLTIPQGLDPQVVNLARSIRQQESGGDYNKSGDSGSSLGAYQWNNQPNGKSIPLQKGELPSNFTAWAKEANLDPTDFSPKNQDMVAYQKIKKLKDAGNNVVDIAAIWNGGDKNRQDPNYVTPSGLPSQKKGVYDVPAYAQAVNNYYQDLKSKTMGGSSNASNNTNTSKRKTFAESLASSSTGNGTQVQYTTPPHSPERIAQYKAEQQGLDQQSKDANSISGIAGETLKNFGDNLTFGGASQLGEQLGTGFAKTTNQVRGLLGGTDNSKYMENMDFGKTTAGLAKTVGGILLTASPGLKGIMSGSSELAQPGIQTILREGSNLLPAEATSTLTKETAKDILMEKLKSLPVSGASEMEQSILKALKELTSTIIEKKSLFNKLATSLWGLGKGALLAKIFGDTVGGMIHQNTK